MFGSLVDTKDICGALVALMVLLGFEDDPNKVLVTLK